ADRLLQGIQRFRRGEGCWPGDDPGNGGRGVVDFHPGLHRWRDPALTSKPPVIQVVDLHKSFGDNQVLRGVNLAVEEGSTLVILGGSGSGKTVLLKHLIGLLKPDGGQVLVEGQDIVPLGAEELAKVRTKFGMVFQSAALFDSMTVYENVSFPLREHRRLKEAEMRRIVREKLAVVDLSPNIEDEYPAQLSGGMRKRVGLARAI